MAAGLQLLGGAVTARCLAGSVTDVQQEKTHNALLQGVEKFDSEQLKKTETQEKNRLPSPDGNV